VHVHVHVHVHVRARVCRCRLRLSDMLQVQRKAVRCVIGETCSREARRLALEEALVAASSLHMTILRHI